MSQQLILTFLIILQSGLIGWYWTRQRDFWNVTFLTVNLAFLVLNIFNLVQIT